MSLADKFRNKVQELRGRIKRNTGKVTGDRGLQAEGRADEVKSNLKQTGEKVKDAFRGRATRRRRRRRRQY
ncbi:MAG TPA: CsbD family protein [Actinophytocola sp.]|nr:CsbD family protein [Actinophytocola sp.]